MVSTLEAVRDLKQEFEKRLANPVDVWGAPMGIDYLDKKTGGIHSGELTVLVADQGTGKSSFSGFIAVNVAEWLQQNHKTREVRIISLEMSAQKYLRRMACGVSGVPVNRVKTGKYINEKQKEQYYAALDYLAGLPIRIIDNVTLIDGQDSNIPEQVSLRQHLSDTIEGKKCGWWILDHFHITPRPKGMGDVTAYEFAAEKITSYCRRIAPGFVLAQMKKDAYTRENKRPIPSDIRYSSLLPNNADWIFGLYREDKYISGAEVKEVKPTELLGLKSRDGEEIGTVYLRFYSDRMHWEVSGENKKVEEPEEEEGF